MFYACGQIRGCRILLRNADSSRFGPGLRDVWRRKLNVAGPRVPCSTKTLVCRPLLGMDQQDEPGILKGTLDAKSKVQGCFQFCLFLRLEFCIVRYSELTLFRVGNEFAIHIVICNVRWFNYRKKRLARIIYFILILVFFNGSAPKSRKNWRYFLFIAV